MKPLVVCLALACCLSFSSLSAQNKKIQFGLASALGARSYLLVDKSYYSSQSKWHGILNYTGGVVARVPISKRFFFKTGVYYSSKSYVFTPVYIFVGEDEWVIPNLPDFIYKSTYLEMPFDFQYHIHRDRKLSMYPLLGIVTSFRVATKAKIKPDSGIDPGSLDARNFYNDFLVSAKAGWGFQFKRENLFAVQIEPQLQFMLGQVYGYENEEGIRSPFYVGVEVAVLKL